jgi:hypothetical protein
MGLLDGQSKKMGEEGETRQDKYQVRRNSDPDEEKGCWQDQEEVIMHGGWVNCYDFS